LLITVVGSLIWLELLIHLVTSFITLIGLVFGLPDIFLGATILALGISTPDTIVNISLAIQNYQMMALSAIFSGQMMNFLVGFGLSCIMRTISRPEASLSLWSNKSKKQTWTLITVLSGSLLNLLFLLLRLKLNKLV
jgi:Ca2+/Na+ antiporter